jgi:hypothetical protein
VWCQYKRKRGILKIERALQTRSSCKECGNIALCLNTRCWQEFYSLEKFND